MCFLLWAVKVGGVSNHRAVLISIFAYFAQQTLSIYEFQIVFVFL